MSRYQSLDLHALAGRMGVNLSAALQQLQALYAEVDARNQKNTAGLDLPCHRGCDMCCHESVFLTPLEFFAAWDYAQTHLDSDTRDAIVARGLQLYQEHRTLIDAFDVPPPPGEPDHYLLAKKLKFTCPLLGSDGACQVYPARELLARLFGCSFNDRGGVYGCHLVDAHLGGKTVTLLPARPTARRLRDLPLTDKRQVYPYYFQALWGEDERP
jgi:Fe-S-cluster containining protein